MQFAATTEEPPVVAVNDIQVQEPTKRMDRSLPTYQTQYKTI